MHTITDLEQSGDGKSGYAPVAVRDEVLKVHVARGDSIGVNHGNAIECLHGSKTNGRLSRGQEHLKDCEIEKLESENIV